MTWTRGAATARWRVDVLDLILRLTVALDLLNRIDGSFAALAVRRLAGVLDQKRVVRRACGHMSGRVLFEEAPDVTVLHRFAERDADRIRDSGDATLERMQELKKAGWLVEHKLSFGSACRGDYAKEFLAISHRWEDKTAPDEEGKQFSAVREFLNSHEGSAIKWVWFE